MALELHQRVVITEAIIDLPQDFQLTESMTRALVIYVMNILSDKYPHDSPVDASEVEKQIHLSHRGATWRKTNRRVS